MTRSFVLGLAEVNQMQVALVGGKGVHLAELLLDGVRVPAGFA